MEIWTKMIEHSWSMIRHKEQKIPTPQQMSRLWCTYLKVSIFIYSVYTGIDESGQTFSSFLELLLKKCKNRNSSRYFYFKGNVGTGLLSLPLAIYHGGWIFGPLMLVFISLMAVHCMHLLVGASQHLCRKLSLQSLDYGEVMSTVLQVKHYGIRNFLSTF